jgi:hypothetical protein
MRERVKVAEEKLYRQEEQDSEKSFALTKSYISGYREATGGVKVKVEKMEELHQKDIDTVQNEVPHVAFALVSRPQPHYNSYL